MSRHQSTLKSPKDVETYHSNEKHSLPKSESFTLKSNTNHVTFQRTYRVVYLGYAVLDRRYTLPMLPWVIAEIKRHGSENEEECDIEVTEQSLKAVSFVTKMLVFEHKLQTISKFAQSSQDSSCFTYMTREVVTGPCAYHVFQASDENIVVELFTAMREMSKEMFNQHPQATVIGKTASGAALDSVINSCQQYEVLYLGRIKVSGKRAPPAFIDDAVEKFRIFEIEKTRSHHGFSKRRRHGSGASVSSLPHNLDILEKPSENGLQKQIKLSSKDDLSTSSGISSCESISQRSLDTINQIYCDTDPALHSSQSSLHNSDQVSTFPVHSQSLVSHSQSMDIASAAKILLDLKQTDCQCSLMPPSSLITHTQSLDAPACADIVRDLRDSDPGVVLRDRVRSCSGDMPRAKQTSLPTFHGKVDIGGIYDMRRPRAYTSPCPSDNRQCNRTMLFLIGRMEICLIGTDKKQMLMSKTFNDIAHCSQGVKHLDHFGFICRETTLSGADCYSGYIFRCQTEKVVDEMMQTLKLAFSKAHQNYQHSEKSYQVPKVFICETCPMHWFHKLCSDIEGLSPEEAHLIILRRLGSLADADKEDIMVKFQETCSNGEQEQNEILMMLLRELCEQKQLKHSHITNSYTNGKNSSHVKEKSSKLDSFRQKAKKSLSSSFETFLKLTNRDDMKDSPVNAVNNTSMNDSATKDLDSRSYREGSCDSSRYLSDKTSPLSSRPRSSTFSTSREMHPSKKQNLTPDPLQNKRPIMNMFMKSSTPLKTPSPLQMESKGSWRQAIFHRVQTPGPSQNSSQIDEINLNLSSLDGESKLRTKKTKEELRALWKKAIIEQILLIRMEKENRKLQVNQDAACSKRMKLNYEEITPCIKAATLEWEAIINDSKHGECSMDRARLMEIVKKGVPRSKRGEIWQYLAEQYRDTFLKSKKDIGSSESYEDLLKQLTSHQHSILIDIGRTFPNHPFYSQTLGSGQLSLFNLLKAYSLLDKEVGYCQGLSFVAGILLLHMPEEQAFSLMKFLMFDLGLRRQYKTDMVAFQIQMYQLSRLIHDNYKDLYDHLEKFDIAPTLYAAPWFLTLFASQFPVGFVARLFDLIFLCGMDVVFKVSLMLLGNYKDCILNCDSFESTMNFLKISLPSIDVLQMQIIFNQVFSLDISRQLHAYEVEYHVLLEEMVHSPNKDSAELENLRSANKKLKAQNMELMEQLQVAYSRIHQLEASDASLKSTVRRLEDRVTALEDEKEGLIYSMRIMKKRLEKLEVERWDKANLSEMENEEHPPPFGVVYALAGSEKEEDEQFKMFIRKYCQEKDIEKGTKEQKISNRSRKSDDIAEENTSVFYDGADFNNL